MGTFVLTDASILLAGLDLTTKSNQIALSHEVETQDGTTFGQDTRINKAGLFVVTGQVGGFTDDVLTGSQIFDAVGAGPSVFQASAPGGDGDIGFAFKSMAMSHQPVGGSIGDMAADSLGLAGKSGDPLVRGTILLPTTTAKTSTGTGTGRQLGDVEAGEKVYGALNVVAVDGAAPTLDVVVESDDNSNFTSATTRLTFAQKTAVGAEWLSDDGAITDDWWRVAFTIGGAGPSFTFQVLVGIR